VAELAPDGKHLICVSPSSVWLCDRTGRFVRPYARPGAGTVFLTQSGRVIAQVGSADRATSYLMGSALIRDDQLTRAQLWLNSILRDQDTAESRLLMGTAKMMANDLTGARADLARAVELNPSSAEGHSYLGLTLLRSGDLAAAAKEFRRGIELDPFDFDACLQLGGLLRQDQQLAEARVYLERALKLRPGDPGALYQTATIDLAEGKVAEARTALESIVKQAPQFVEAHVSLATVYYRLKRKEDGDREREIVKALNAAAQEQQPGVKAAEADKR